MATSPPLFILLCSADRDKIQMAGMVAAVAAVSERPVQLFVSMGAIKAFEKNLDAASRYRPGHFSDELQRRKAPDPIDLIKQGKMLGDMKVYACSMVLDVLDWKEDRLEEDLFDGTLGLTKFLSDAETGQLMTL